MKLLTQFMETFIGYGSFDASTWFIGQEEAGVRNVQGLLERIAVWRELGCKSVVDIAHFHELLGKVDLFGETPKIQRTWRRLIEIKLVLLGEKKSKHSVRKYQAEELGRVGGDTLLGELMPLPKPSVKSWPYAELAAELPYMKTQKEYRKTIGPIRTMLLSDAISKHKPKMVVFYGVTTIASWEKVAEVSLEEVEEDIFEGSNGYTRFLVMKHPNTWGVQKSYYKEVEQIALSR